MKEIQVKCENCNGTGFIMAVWEERPEEKADRVECPICHSTGYVPQKAKPSNMHASKENAEKALLQLKNMERDSLDYLFVREFIEVALRKLPHEASFTKVRNKKDA